MSKVILAKDVVQILKSDDTLALCGFTLMGACETILKEIESNYMKNKAPRDLTLIHAAGHSNRINGIEHLAHEGLIKRIIGSHWGLAPKWSSLINENKVSAHCLPQGQLTHLFRAMAGGKPGNFSRVGMGTFVDPNLEGGRINERSRSEESYVSTMNIQDERYLFYQEVPLDICLIRGTTADTAGNITFEDEALKLESISIAQATKRYGGKVIIQVKNLVNKGTLAAKDVVIPGIYVDHIVVAENPLEEHRQTDSAYHNPVFSGNLKEPLHELPSLPLTIKKVIGRRAVEELFPGAIVNLGTGIPGDIIGPVAEEEGVLKDIYLTIESGAIGGQPLGGTDFGLTRNAEAIIEHPYQFDYYTGRGVDITFMGMAEVDSIGNINVSRFGSKTVGCGGFIDITQNARKVIFCTTFKAVNSEIKIIEKGLEISREGKVRKFVDELSQVTFSGDVARKNKQTVLIITERAVFRLIDNGIELIEIAPNINVQTDIVDQMAFEPIISPKLKVMDQTLFMK